MNKVLLFSTLLSCIYSNIIYIPEDYSTIQTGLNSANEGDTVLVSNGTYVENINWPSTNGIKLIGSSPEDCIIDGEYNRGVLRFMGVEIDSSTIVKNFTITNGFANAYYDNEMSGGINIVYDSDLGHTGRPSPKFENLIITENFSAAGGGISCNGAGFHLKDVSIINNTADDIYWGDGNAYMGNGGGIFIRQGYNAPISISNVIISENSSVTNGTSSYNNGCGGGIFISNTYDVIGITIDQISVQDNSASDYGGGIYFASGVGNIHITNSEINNNIAEDGGALSLYTWSSPVIENVILNGNTVTGRGGGVYIYNTHEFLLPQFYNVAISNNTASTGGAGIYFDDASPQLDNVMISNNNSYKGGGVYCSNNSSPVLNSTVVSGNTAIYGGGVYSDDSSPILNDSEVKNNDVSQYGGGILGDNSNVTFQNVLISDNASDNRGAGVDLNYSSYFVFENTTLSNNVSSSDYGSGIFIDNNSTASFSSSILWNNFPREVKFNNYGTPVSFFIEYSDIEGGEDQIDHEYNGSVNWGDGNIDFDPYFCTSTFSDYSLSENSPCIDSGLNSANMGALLGICDGICDGDIIIDDCGICGGDNSTCVGCMDDGQLDTSPFTYAACNYDESFTIHEPSLCQYPHDLYDGYPGDYDCYGNYLSSKNILQASSTLVKAYPNPFNPSTTIKYFLEKPTNVELNIYDMNGIIVETLYKGYKISGNHQAIWMPQVSSGQYFIQLKVDGSVMETQKIILLK